MDRKKIVLIGAGSSAFSEGLMADLILSGQTWDLGLVDINPEALRVAQGLCRRMIALRGADIRVEAATDRCVLLPGADVVVTTIAVGGRRGWEADVFIPRKYGVYQPVGDSVTCGGISRSLRMIPAMVDIARDVVRLAPEARFFNYSNPMTTICWGVRRVTGAPIVGLCIGTHSVQRSLARFICAPPEEVTALAAGVNHFTWIYDLRWNGRDAWPLVRERVAREKTAGDATPAEDQAPGGDSTLRQDAQWTVSENPFSWQLFETYGAYPAVNDRHVTEFFMARFPRGSYGGKMLGIDQFSLEAVIARGDESYARHKAQALGESPMDDSIFARRSGEHAQLVEILAALDNDSRTSFTANLPNKGSVPNLPDDAILEMTCVATGRGLRPIPAPDFPDTLAAPLARYLAVQRLTVEAALTGSRALFVEALLLDGAAGTRSVAIAMADELLAAHREYLPQFSQS